MKKIGVLSQKGGVGKSTLASMLAVEYARAGWKVRIADMDASQGSLVEWNQRRVANAWQPSVEVSSFHTTHEALNKAYDIVIFDGAPHASFLTKEMATLSDLILLPTGCSIMDLNPQIRLAHELLDEGVKAQKILFVLNKTGSSQHEILEALHYLHQTDYAVCKGFVPEKTAFRKLLIEGKTLTETHFKSLRKACEEVLQDIINKVNELTI